VFYVNITERMYTTYYTRSYRVVAYK